MKLKNILAAAIMVAATVGITSSVYAATAVKVGTVEGTTFTTDDVISVPIIIETTDESVDNIGAYDINVNFDNSKLEYGLVQNNLVTKTKFATQTSGSIVSTPDTTANANGSVRLSYTTTSPTKLSNSPNATCTVLFVPKANGYTFDPSDIQIKLNQMVSTTNTTGATNTLIYADSFKTYVSFDVPDTYDKYIHKVYLQLNGDD